MHLLYVSQSCMHIHAWFECMHEYQWTVCAYLHVYACMQQYSYVNILCMAGFVKYKCTCTLCMHHTEMPSFAGIKKIQLLFMPESACITHSFTCMHSYAHMHVKKLHDLPCVNMHAHASIDMHSCTCHMQVCTGMRYIIMHV